MRRSAIRQLATFIAVLAIILSICWVVVGLLVAHVVPGGWRTVLAVALLATVLPLGLFFRQRASGSYPGRWERLLVFRPFWYAQLALILCTLAGAVGAVGGLVVARPGDGGRLLAGAMLLVFAVASVWGYVDAGRLRLRRIEAVLPELPPALDGLRLVQLTDLHVGPHTSRRFLRRALELTRAAQPQLVVVTGDLVDDFPGDVACYARAFDTLAAPLGVYVSVGNHEVYAGWPAVRERLRALPLTVLVNEHRVLHWNGACVVLAATGDPAGGHHSASGGVDVDAMLAGAPDGAPVIAMAHNPALWPALARRGVALTLSGHTHWGQFAIPRRGWSLAGAFLTLAMGAHQDGASLLWIHPGTNYWGIPFRLGTPPEVLELTLRTGDAPSLRGTDGPLPSG